MTPTGQSVDVPVRKTITVRAPVERAFDVFTAGFDSWWPRSHHIGKSPLQTSVIELKLGGRCYGRCVDGTDADWGTVLAWEPPTRFVIAWQITADWQYQPDVAQSSEVEVRFTPEPDGSTRVDLEHRRFDRMGATGAGMRAGVDSPNGWGALLTAFRTEVEKI